ncbi:MAG: hypothetical protein D6812_05175 [Deltaproteobacteria bacterium]|nr:MAG: hypothetical protein D6812_05175 [Deltaproteobacteria bacterium]
MPAHWRDDEVKMNRRKSRSGVKIGMLCILLWLFGGDRDARGEGVRVVSSSEQGVVIDLDLGLPRHVDGGIRLDLPAGRGMTILQGNEAFAPLPCLFLNVGVLPGRQVSLRIQPLEGAISLPLPPDGKGRLPKILGEIGDIVFFGHLKIARLRVNPFLPEGERLRFYRRLRLSLDFTDPVPTERRITPRRRRVLSPPSTTLRSSTPRSAGSDAWRRKGWRRARPKERRFWTSSWKRRGSMNSTFPP